MIDTILLFQDIKNIFNLFYQGTLFTLTFGIYNGIKTHEIIEDNNKKHKLLLESIKINHRNEINELKEQIKKLERKNHWWN